MKTQISRSSHDPSKRYTGVYQQQGRMITDADWNELVDVFKTQLRSIVRHLVGTGVPLPLQSVRGLRLEMKAEGLTIQPGVVYLDGLLGRYPAPPTVYPQQHDFPGAPGPVQVGDLIYLDAWEQPVTALEDSDLIEPALSGADTCTRVRTLVQIKRAPSGVDIADVTRNPPIGDALLTITTGDRVADVAPCLFRLEVHEVAGLPGAPDSLTLKWSFENGAEAVSLTQAGNPPPEWTKDSAVVREYFGDNSERTLGVHMVDGYVRPAGSLGVEVAPAGATAVRRWDGFCVLASQGSDWKLERGRHREHELAGGTQLRFEAGTLQLKLDGIELGLTLVGKKFVSGDFWHAAIRSGHERPLVASPPAGIQHRYCALGRIGVEEGSRLTFVPDDELASFPPLSALGSQDGDSPGAALIGGSALTAGGASIPPGTVRQQLLSLLRLIDGVGEASATGAVVMQEFKNTTDVKSQTIDPGLGPGKLDVNLGLDTPNNGCFVGEPELAPSGVPAVKLGALIDPSRGTFQVLARATAGTPSVTVRWWAIRPRRDLGQVTVPRIIITPEAPTLDQGATQPFQASVLGASSSDVTWSVEGGAANGSFAGNIFTAPKKKGTVWIRATSQADPAVWVLLAVSVNAVTVSVDAVSVSLLGGEKRQLKASVAGTTEKGVDWKVVEGVAGGTITPAGEYQAPTTHGRYHVQVMSKADPSAVASTEVAVDVPSVEILPPSASVLVDRDVDFKANVLDSYDTRIEWDVVEATGGNIGKVNGHYDAPSVPAVYHVRATSVRDRKVARMVAVTVEKVSLTGLVSPVGLFNNDRYEFKPTVQGTTNQTVRLVIEEGDAGGRIEGMTYIAPDRKGTFHVLVSSARDPQQQARIEMRVDRIELSIVPPQTSVVEHGTVDFKVIPNTEIVSWSTSSHSATIDPVTGKFKAAKAEVCSVYATSQRDPDAVFEAKVTVVIEPPPDCIGTFPDCTGTVVEQPACSGLAKQKLMCPGLVKQFVLCSAIAGQSGGGGCPGRQDMLCPADFKQDGR